MSGPRYNVEYDGFLGLYRWRVEPGERLAPPARRPSVPPPRVVALGGGTGLPVVLKGLKAVLFTPGRPWVPARDRDRLTAIVTVADDGGSSGRLRRAYHVLPPGDLRNCPLALSEGEPTTAALFNFRFDGGGELAGHSLGNLVLTALAHLEGDFLGGLTRVAELMAVRGQIYPATLEDVTLVAEFADGSSTEGESRIASVQRPIRRLSLAPPSARAVPGALEAVRTADLLVIGPGSLYTSLIPILLIRELAAAIADSKARVVLVMNLMTEPGETDHLAATDHLLALRRHAPQMPIHDVLPNAARIPEGLVERYAAEGALPVPVEPEALRSLGPRPVTRDLLGTGPKIRHDPTKLAAAILELASEAS